MFYGWKRLLSHFYLFQVEEEIKSDLYILFFHIVQRIPEYLIHLQVGPQHGNCVVQLLSHQVTLNSKQVFGSVQVLTNSVGSLKKKTQL